MIAGWVGLLASPVLAHDGHGHAHSHLQAHTANKSVSPFEGGHKHDLCPLDGKHLNGKPCPHASRKGLGTKIAPDCGGNPFGKSVPGGNHASAKPGDLKHSLPPNFDNASKNHLNPPSPYSSICLSDLPPPPKSI